MPYRIAGRALGIACIAGFILGGCASGSQPLYYWGSYQPQVYQRLKGETTPEEQIGALEEDVQKARSKGLALPPGYHAHLGLLYAEIGKEDQVRQEFETEKTLFPESATYMDFLMRNFKK